MLAHAALVRWRRHTALRARAADPAAARARTRPALTRAFATWLCRCRTRRGTRAFTHALATVDTRRTQAVALRAWHRALRDRRGSAAFAASHRTRVLAQCVRVWRQRSRVRRSERWSVRELGVRPLRTAFERWRRSAHLLRALVRPLAATRTRAVQRMALHRWRTLCSFVRALRRTLHAAAAAHTRRAVWQHLSCTARAQVLRRRRTHRLSHASFTAWRALAVRARFARSLAAHLDSLSRHALLHVCLLHWHRRSLAAAHSTALSTAIGLRRMRRAWSVWSAAQRAAENRCVCARRLCRRDVLV